jgi:polyhydroxybutyrate depolymerase
MRAPTELPPGFRQYDVTFDGRLRSNLVFVPNLLAKPAPLLLALHGGGGHPAAIARVTQFHRIAQREGFLLAYPAGLGPTPRRLNWNAGGPEFRGWSEKHAIDDVGFIRALIDQLKTDYVVDPDRIYLAGMSKGGMLAYKLACEASGLFAAIAPVAATMVTKCYDSPAKVAVMHIHGAVDRNVPLEGGSGRRRLARRNWPPVRDGLEYWRAVNDCAAPELKNPNHPEVAYYHCEASNGSAHVELLVVKRCGHVWPGARPGLLQRLLVGPINTRFDASRQIWQFFQDKRKTLVGAAQR